MFAIIKTGGKQYLVSPKDTLNIEKIPGDAGSQVVFDQVLLVAEPDGKDVNVGKPVVSGANVTATIVKQFRAKKITIVKFKQKAHYRRTLGHRQHFTQIIIGEVK